MPHSAGITCFYNSVKPLTRQGADPHHARVPPLNQPPSVDIDPLVAIQELIEARVGPRGLYGVALESCISRPMLHAVLHDWHEPGRDTLALLVAWDEAFRKPVSDYLLVHGTWLRELAVKERVA